MGNTSKSPLNNEGRYSVLDYATSIFDRCFSENRKYIGDATVRDPNGFLRNNLCHDDICWFLEMYT